MKNNFFLERKFSSLLPYSFTAKNPSYTASNNENNI